MFVQDSNKPREVLLKIAIPMAEGVFSEHFGGAKEFMVFEINRETKSFGAGELFPAPEHKPGALPKWLATHKMNAVIVSSIGERALLMLAHAGIDAFLSEGDLTPSELVSSFLQEKLTQATKDNHRCHGGHHDHDHDHDHDGHNCHNH